MRPIGTSPSGGRPPAPMALALAAALGTVAAVLLLTAGTIVSHGLGIPVWAALLALWGCLLGGWVNIPVRRVRTEMPQPLAEVRVFGVRYLVRPAVPPHETLIAVNLGGAVLPVVFSAWLLVRADAWAAAGVAVAAVTLLAWWAARPVPGVGIVLPTLLAPAAAALVALLVAPGDAPAVAYAAGTLGALIGADLLHLREIERLGASVAAIGGAGTFDGIFLSGLVAVLLASV